MDRSTKRRFFEQSGRQGGLKRAKKLSPLRRSAIASQGAYARWNKKSPPFLASVRLNNPQWDDPAYLEDILSEGSLADWRRVYQILADHPFGSVATALKKVLVSTAIYGVTPLWRKILQAHQSYP